MFNLNDPNQTELIKDKTLDNVGGNDIRTADQQAADNPLDDSTSQELHRRLISFYRQELDRQADNRFQMAVDEDYYDSIQWTEEEARILKERGQAPIVYNVIAQSINWVIGSEKRGRTDFKILPRQKTAAKPAEGKTKLLKYLSDVNRLPFERSRAFEDVVKVGLGWLEDGVQEEDDGEPIYSQYESWRNILWDSASNKLDLSDCRYISRSKWTDLDVAVALVPGREQELRAAVVEGDRYGGFDIEDGDEFMDNAEFQRENHGLARTLVTTKRERVRIIEMWYRVPEKVEKLRGGPFNGDILDREDPRHVETINQGLSTVVSKVMMRVRVALMTHSHLLFEGPSPYRHNRFPFTPIWGFRRGRDNLPYGLIRWMRDIQDDINKRASKALHILSTNKTVMDKGAVDDIDEFIEEVARPDAVIIKNPGKALELNVDRELAPAHLDLMSRNIQMLQQVGGVTDELLGRSTNAVSGVAITARQEQGSVATNKLFDNLRLGVQMQGELQLSLIEQFVTVEKSFRITNQRGNADFVTINDGLPENDITRTKADFIISEADWRATMRQAQTAELTDLVSKMPPQVAMVMLDLLVDGMDIENRDELVKRIRQINGQKDPDATEPTPEEIQAAQQQQQEAEFQIKLAMAKLDEQQNKADKLKAEIANLEATAARTRTLTMGDKIVATQGAMESALAVVTTPTIAKVADALLENAGWESWVPPPMGGLPPYQPPEPPQAPPMQQQQEQQPVGPGAQMPPEAAPENVPVVPNDMVQPGTQDPTQPPA